MSEVNLPIFNDPVGPHFAAAIAKLHRLAGLAQVSYSINYSDGPNLWYIDIRSAASSENFQTKDHTLSIAFELALEHLMSITRGMES